MKLVVNLSLQVMACDESNGKDMSLPLLMFVFTVTFLR